MKKKRNESEERFKFILQQLSLNYDIKEPDTDSNILGTADFLLGNTVFEVKEIIPKEIESIEVRDMLRAFRARKPFAHFKPDIYNRFRTHLRDAKKKFKLYKNYSTCLVIDLVQWGELNPEIETLITGIQAIEIGETDNGEIVHRECAINKLFRIDEFTQVGTVMFLFHDKLLIYHNLMSIEQKILPLEFIIVFSKFVRIPTNQYFFINIPGGKCHIRQLR